MNLSSSKIRTSALIRALLSGMAMIIALMATLPAQASPISMKSATSRIPLGSWRVNKLPSSWHGFAPPKVIPDKVCSDPNVMYNLNSGKVAEVYHSGTGNYSNVDQWSANGTQTQQWCFYKRGSFRGVATYEMVNNHSGKCMDVYHSKAANGTNVDQYTCNGTGAQEWFISAESVAYGFSPLLDVKQGLPYVLEVYRAGKSNGDNVDIWTNHGGYGQQWCPGPCH